MWQIDFKMIYCDIFTAVVLQCEDLKNLKTRLRSEGFFFILHSDLSGCFAVATSEKIFEKEEYANTSPKNIVPCYLTVLHLYLR